MATKSSNRWFLTRITLPIATALLMLTGCKNTNSSTANSANCDHIHITIIDNDTDTIDSLLHENRRLTDSLSAVNKRLDKCKGTRDKKKSNQNKTKQTKQNNTQPASNRVTIENNNTGNNTVIIGNDNTVNNVIINGATSAVQDTLSRVKTTRRIMSGHAKTTYTYTK